MRYPICIMINLGEKNNRIDNRSLMKNFNLLNEF